MSNKENDIAKHYKRKEIESTPPGRLIVMLYGKALEHLDNAEEVQKGDDVDKIEKYHNSLVTCQSIITELTVALDMEKGGDLAKNLYRLYDFMNYRLMDANVKKEIKAIHEVRDLLLTLKAGWEEVQDTPIDEGQFKKGQTGLNLKG